MYTAILLLSAAVLILVIKLFAMKKCLRSIAEQITEKSGSDTNTLVSISSGDKSVKKLAVSINELLRNVRDKRHRYEHGDAELKTAVINVSHDIRTPLTAVCGYLELLKREELSENAEKYVQIISERTEAMKQLTEELFRYSVIIKSDDSDENEETDVNAVLTDSILGFYGTLTEKGIEPEIDICDEKVIRCVNSSNLARVFSNLISNALKYSDGDLCISLDKTGKIVFSNRASGLDSIQTEKLFDRFYTVSSARTSTGLGLSIAKSFIEKMNGTMDAEYSEGRLVIRIQL